MVLGTAESLVGLGGFEVIIWGSVMYKRGGGGGEEGGGRTEFF